MRVALVLPVHSSREAIAATRVIIGLLRTYGRTELALSPAARSLPGQPHRAEFRQVLFVAVDVDLALGAAVTQEDVEATIRTQIERQYARHGMPNVDYDLQIL